MDVIYERPFSLSPKDDIIVLQVNKLITESASCDQQETANPKCTMSEDETTESEIDPFESFETASMSSSASYAEPDGESESNCAVDVDDVPQRRIRLKQYGSQERNFYDEDGYLYSINNNDPGVKSYYFRCKNDQKFKCKARAISKNKDLNDTILKGKHSHSGQISAVDAMKFRYNLNEEIEKSPLEFGREVYLKTMDAMVNEIDVTNAPDKKELGSFIYRRKLKFVPKLPKTVTDFEDMVKNRKYRERFTKDRKKQPFYRGVWKSSEGGCNIAYISETVWKIVILLSSIVLRMDGTFKVLPRHIKFRQLFIISVIYREKSYPLAYILMEKRNFQAYDNVFTRLSEIIPSAIVSEVMADYEAATRKAVVKNYPKARLVGCWFHYVQAINRIAKRFGLLRDDKFSDPIKHISALALLPHNYISDGFDYIGTHDLI